MIVKCVSEQRGGEGEGGWGESDSYNHEESVREEGRGGGRGRIVTGDRQEREGKFTRAD